MQFKGSNRVEREGSLRAWEAWLRTVRPTSNRARFAHRLVELIESRVGSPQPHVANVAPWAMRQAMAELGRPLNQARLQEVLTTLHRCWKHGLALRNWAVKRGYME